MGRRTQYLVSVVAVCLLATLDHCFLPGAAAEMEDTCQLEISVDGDKLSRAVFKCEPAGGKARMRVLANMDLLGDALEDEGWVSVKSCGKGSLGPDDCLLTICDGAKAIFTKPKIVGVPWGHDLRRGLLCISGSATSITLDEPNFSQNVDTSVFVVGAQIMIRKGHFNLTQMADRVDVYYSPALNMFNGTSATIEGTMFGNNTNGALGFQGTGQMHISECNFVGNGKIEMFGGAVHVNVFVEGNPDIKEPTSVVIADSWFTENSVYNGLGGAVYVNGNPDIKEPTSVVIADSLFRENSVYNGWGGALYADDCSKLSITGTTFQGNKAEKQTDLSGAGGALAVWGETAGVANITYCNFSSNSAIRSAGGGIFYGASANLTLSHVSFEGNFCEERGGGMEVFNATVWMGDGCSFSNNFAKNGDGAGLAVSGNANVTFKGNASFIANIARNGQGGGVVLHDVARVAFDGGCLFDGNTASYVGCGGGGLSADGSSHVAISLGCRFVNNVAGPGSVNGGGVSACSNAQLLLQGAQFVNNSAKDGAGGAIFVSDSAGAAANVTARAVEFYNNSAKTGADIKAPADGNIHLEGSNITFASPTVDLKRTTCYRGEVLHKGECTRCQDQTYSLDPKAEDCNLCPDHANCTEGYIIEPRSGYWHSGPYSLQIHACQREEACEYGGTCAAGYLGNLCGSCQGPEYSLVGPFRCRRCLPRAATIGLYLGGAALLIGAMLVMVELALQDNANGDYSMPRPSFYFKVLVRHVQYLVVLSSLRVSWPDGLEWLFKAAGFVFSVATSQAVSLSCLFSRQGPLPAVIKNLLVVLFAPLAMLLAVILLRVVVMSLARRFWPRLVMAVQWKSLLSVSALVAVFFFYPSLVRVGLSMFACHALDSSTSDPYPEYAVANASRGYWVFDMQQPCWQGWHKKWALGLGIPCSLIFCLGFPLGILASLHFGKKRTGQQGEMSLSRQQSSSSYGGSVGFLTNPYKPNRYWWEAVSIFQLACLVVISIFSSTLGAYNSTLLFNTAFGLFFALQLLCKPNVFDEVHVAQLLSWACLFVTSTLGLSLFDPESSPAKPQAYTTFVGAAGFIMNAAYVGFSLWRTAVQFAAEHIEKLRAWRDRRGRRNAWMKRRERHTGAEERQGEQAKGEV